ncbi:UNVERIFIED_ORG: hypothetical protein QQG_2944, partial [Clostridioides difficile Y384]
MKKWILKYKGKIEERMDKMSFEKINNNNLDKIHNRKCIMLVN